jgi:membrane protein involved in D-alanine export
MNVCSIEWLLSLMIASAVFFSVRDLRFRQLMLGLLNLGFLLTLVLDVSGWLTLAVFLYTGYLAAKIMRIWPRRIVLITYLAVLLVSFVFLKQYAFVRVLVPSSWFHHVVVTVGLSYMLFRQIQVVVDAFQGQIEKLSLWSYLNYQLNLFGLLAGPIQRYQQFCDDWNRLEPILVDAEAVFRAYLRVFVGVLKIAVIANLCLSAVNKWTDVLANGTTDSHDTSWKSIAYFMAIFYLYPAYVYFNFSGYCDMVIGGASLFGMKMPENFNWPFIARNMIEYWTRWHRTLGFWIRDYVFTPLYKAVAGHWPARAASLAFLCYFVALFLTGIWHGSTWNFVIFGLLNGLGVAAAKLWENYLIARVGRQGLRKYLQSGKIQTAAIVANFHYVCLTILFFRSDLGTTLHIIHRVVRIVF